MSIRHDLKGLTANMLWRYLYRNLNLADIVYGQMQGEVQAQAEQAWDEVVRRGLTRWSFGADEATD